MLRAKNRAREKEQFSFGANLGGKNSKNDNLGRLRAKMGTKRQLRKVLTASQTPSRGFFMVFFNSQLRWQPSTANGFETLG